MATLEDFTNEELLKVLLEAKSISQGLSVDEQEVYDMLPTLERSRRRETVIFLSNNGFITVELQRIQQTVRGAKIWNTFPSTERTNGITSDGIRLLYELRGNILSNAES